MQTKCVTRVIIYFGIAEREPQTSLEIRSEKRGDHHKLVFMGEFHIEGGISMDLLIVMHESIEGRL